MQPDYHKMIGRGSVIALLGYLFSGPLGYGAIRLLHPQPAWTSAEVLVNHYHWTQDLPFYFGFLLIGGMLIVTTGHFLRAENEDRGYALLSLVFTIVFASLIFFNYFVQITFVRNLILDYRPEYDKTLTEFSMVNPMSMSWGIEMWGYGILGVAMWFLAPLYGGQGWIRLLLIANGVISCAGGIVTAINQRWVLTAAGFISYAGWNIVIIALMLMIFQHSRNLDAQKIRYETHSEGIA